jgi:hypothetical protein
MDPNASCRRRPNSLDLADPDIAFLLFSLEALMLLFSPLELEHAQRVA